MAGNQDAPCFMPTALFQFIQEIHKGKCGVLYIILSPTNCNCIGFRPVNTSPKEFILFNVAPGWSSIVTDKRWHEAILVSGCEVCPIESYKEALTGQIKEGVEIINSCIEKIATPSGAPSGIPSFVNLNLGRK